MLERSQGLPKQPLACFLTSVALELVPTRAGIAFAFPIAGGAAGGNAQNVRMRGNPMIPTIVELAVRQLKFRGVLRIHALVANTPYRLAYQRVASVKRLVSLAGIRACWAVRF